jgi:hypothetical protein
MTGECVREQDVLDALTAGRWPGRCDDDLRAHVSGCAVCRDLADVARAMIAEQDVAWRDARVPSAGVMWWRAQLRAREDAARAAGRPVAFIQGVAASVVVWLVIALFRAVPPESVAAWRSSAAELLPNALFEMMTVSRVTALLPLVVFLLVGAWLLLTPIAAYLAVGDE